MQTDFRPPIIFRTYYNANLRPTIFEQARCSNIKGAKIDWKKLDEKNDCEFYTLPAEELRLYSKKIPKNGIIFFQGK